MPQFGATNPDADYIVRPSVYAILRDNSGLIATVLAPVGWFLPGGGIETGEDDQTALIRELREETGIVVAVQRLLGAADEYLFSPTKKAYYKKQCHFYLASAESFGSSSEIDHELHWLPPSEAAKRMYHQSHTWAIKKFIPESPQVPHNGHSNSSP